MSSLYKRLLSWLLASLSVLWLAVGGAVYVTVRGSLEGRFDAELTAMASDVRHLFHGQAGQPSPGSSAYWIDFYRKDSGLYFEVWDEYLLFSDRSPSLGSRVLPRPAAFAERAQIWNFTLATGERLRGIAQRFPLPRSDGAASVGAETPAVNVIVARQRDRLDRSLGLLLATTGLVGVLIVPISFLIVWGAVGRGLHPLRAFAERVSAFGFGSMDERFQTEGLPGELVPISKRLNELMDRLKAGLERERRLNADLAHELRTPVAELKTMAEVALAWPEKIDAANYREVLEAARQMQAIIESMLLLARWERESAGPSLVDVSLSEALSRSWQPLAERAAGKQLDVPRCIPSDLVVRTSPDILHIILSNLLANAVEYSPPSGRITITAARDGQGWQLELANTVTDLEEADLPRLFERFWRRSEARSGPRHAGLGLALAKQCADLLALQLTARLEQDSRTIIFRVAPRSTDEQRADEARVRSVAGAEGLG